jgi:hypothetical protein
MSGVDSWARDGVSWQKRHGSVQARASEQLL